MGSWGTDLWDQEGLLVQKVDADIEFANRWRGIAGQYAQLEMEHSKQIQKLVVQLKSQPIPGLNVSSSIGQAWKAMVEGMEAASKKHEEVSSAILAEVCVPLKALMKDTTSKKADQFKSVAKLRSDLAGHAASIEKTKKKVEKAEKEAEVAKVAFEKTEKNESASKKKIDTARLGWASKAKNAESLQHGLDEEMKDYNIFRRGFYRAELPDVFNAVQSLSENHNEQLVRNFEQFCDCSKNSLAQQTSTWNNVIAVVNKFDKAADSQEFARGHASGKPVPEFKEKSKTTAKKPAGSPRPSRSPKATRKQEEPEEKPEASQPSPEKAPQPPAPAENFPKCRALYTFPGANEGELPLQENELLDIVENDGSGWVLCQKGDSRGYVPETYIEAM